MNPTLIQPEDYKYYIEKPDSNFSPERNRQIIQETITETKAYFAGIGRAAAETMGDKIDLLSSYARYRFNTGTKDIEGYAGKKLLTQLVGEKILSKVRVMDTVNRLNGNDKFNKHILI